MRTRRLIAGILLAGAGAVSAAETVTYTYDARGRLVEVVHGGGASSGADVAYTYDAAGNRTRVVVTGASH